MSYYSPWGSVNAGIGFKSPIGSFKGYSISARTEYGVTSGTNVTVTFSKGNLEFATGKLSLDKTISSLQQGTLSTDIFSVDKVGAVKADVFSGGTKGALIGGGINPAGAATFEGRIGAGTDKANVYGFVEFGIVDQGFYEAGLY